MVRHPYDSAMHTQALSVEFDKSIEDGVSKRILGYTAAMTILTLLINAPLTQIVIRLYCVDTVCFVRWLYVMGDELHVKRHRDVGSHYPMTLLVMSFNSYVCL